jgi:hypothetical protein
MRIRIPNIGQQYGHPGCIHFHRQQCDVGSRVETSDKNEEEEGEGRGMEDRRKRGRE